MASTTAISSQTAAATSSDITIASGSSIQVWTSLRMGQDETVGLYRTDGGSVEEEVVESNNPARITVNKPSLAISGPGIFRLKKSVTGDAVAVYYDS